MDTGLKQKASSVGIKVEKMPRIPKDARIHKRPLIHPQISSPFAGRSSEKIVYISSKTPFMSAIKRVQHLLDQIRKRDVQSELSRQKARTSKWRASSASPARSAEPEPVIVTATGKAIDKALRLAVFLQSQSDTTVRIRTTSADAIDDIVPKGDDLQFPVETPSNSSSNGGNTVASDTATGGTSEEMSKPPNILEPYPSSRIRHTSVIQIIVTRQ